MKKTAIHRLYAMEFVSQAVAIYTLYSIMFQERSGVTAAQLGMLLATFSVTTILSEIPTGIIADHFSRKWSLIASKLLLAAGMLTWLVAPSFSGYLAGMILFGISEALSSGATQAYLYDNLADKQTFAHFNTRMWAVMMGGWTLGAAIAAAVGIRYNTLLVLSILAPIIGGIIALTLPSDRQQVVDRRRTETLSLIKNFRSAVGYVMRSKLLFYSVVSIVMLKTLVDVIIEYIPVYYRDAGVATSNIPLLFMVGNGISFFVFWYGSRLATLLRRKELLLGVAMLVLLGLSSQGTTAVAVAGIFLYVRFVRVVFISLEGQIQHHIDEAQRATVSSLYSMFIRLFMSVSLVIIGTRSGGQGGVVYPVLVFTIILYALYMVSRLRGYKMRTPTTTSGVSPTDISINPTL